MYRPVTTKRDRAATIAAVVLIHAGLAYAFLNMSGTLRAIEEQADLQLFDLSETPPPPPIVEIPPEPEQARPEAEEAPASPRNVESVATPVVAPKPRIALPVPVPMAVTETPNIGNEPTQGASPLPGPGTGAGGIGTGTGSGGSGSGTGGGGGGGISSPPRLIRGNITPRDYPRELRSARTPREEIEMEFNIGTDGRVRGCRAIRSSGSPILDAATCRLVEERYVYRPALDDAGQPTTIVGRMRRSWWFDR
ncbi:MAG: energy transducer TonB [Pseudomonadota bacterium]|nr:energy transducer TonB [Pseudomonadota bacterium]